MPTAAILARSMLPPAQAPRVITTLHGTDTTLLGADTAYRPAIHHALTHSDAVTVVSDFLKRETQRVLGFDGPMEVIHNFFEPGPALRSRDEVRRELGLHDELMILHSSNLRPLKRIDLLLETAALIRPRKSFKLVILAGGDFKPFISDVSRLGLERPGDRAGKTWWILRIIWPPPIWDYSRRNRRVFAWAFLRR